MDQEAEKDKIRDLKHEEDSVQPCWFDDEGCHLARDAGGLQ